MHRPLIISLFLVAFGGLPLVPRCYAQQIEDLSTSLSMERSEFGASDDLRIQFTLTNNSQQAVNVLRWHTPLEGFNTDMFEVEQNGESVEYIGRVVKRGAPQPEDYVEIQPGQSVSAEVDLDDGYRIYEAATYSVQLQSQIVDFGADPAASLAAKEEFSAATVDSNTLTFALTEARAAPAALSLTPPAASMDIVDAVEPKAPAFKNCSSTQQATLDTALTEAARAAALSVLFLEGLSEGNRASCQRYTTWFGSYTAARWDRVTNNFTKVHDALANETITFNCDCNESYYAYVYPSQPYEIWLCNAFWPAPMTGTDSKAGTVIHEASHFNVVADTDDVAYGHSSCKSLAQNDPNRAIENADSHEYFAENNPVIKCGIEHVALAIVFFGLPAAWYTRRRWFVL